MTKKSIAKILRQALLHDGSMEYELYKFELEESIAYRKEGLKKIKKILYLL